MSWLMSPSLRIRSDELRTVRQAMRDVGTLLSELEDGDVKKLVNTQRDWSGLWWSRSSGERAGAGARRL